MPRKKLIWNVATAKTGNSARWDFVRFNRTLFKDSGLLIAPLLTMEHSNWGDTTQGPGKVGQLLRESEQPVVIIEHDTQPEMCRHSDKVRKLREFWGDPEMTAVVYLRRQDLYLESLYREVIRSAAGPAIPFGYERMIDYFDADLFDYANLIRFLEKGFDHVVVRVFERSAFVDGDLFHDFCAAMNVPWNSDFRVPGRKVNRAPDARLSKILVKCNERLAKDGGKARRVKEIFEELGRLYFDKPEDAFFSNHERRAFLDRFAEGNAWIAEKYGLGKDGRLFDTSDLEKRAEPEPLTLDDAILLQLYLNQAWLDGLGAVPFSVYNYQKKQYLKLKRGQVKPARRFAISLQILLHQALHAMRRYLVPRKWKDELAEGTAMNYVMKNIALFAEAKGDYLGGRRD
jgi:hypothetical protein